MSSIKDLLAEYEKQRKVPTALGYAMWLIGWDSETEAPRGCFGYRSKQIGTLSELSYKLFTSPESIALINELSERASELDLRMQKEIKKVKKELDNITKIPMHEFVAYQMLRSEAQNIWVEAKNKSDFQLFAPYLDKIIAYQQKLTEYLATETRKGYDVLLDRYEEDITMADYDQFFQALKEELVPFVHEITSKNHPQPAFVTRNFSVEGQKKFSHYIMDVMQYDRSRGLMKESEHPFTSGVNSRDVRFTNHFYEDNLLSSIFSAIHELGHATYEQQCNPELDDTELSGGASMAMHESQSRFYENIIGRSYAFWKEHFPKLKELYPVELSDVTVDDFYRAVNHVEKSLIRVEADELTYPLHIMVRYDLERAIMNKELTVQDLPREWNRLVKEYLGLDVPNDKLGVLQDVHWSGGMFGYFPTYALGSAFSAQIYYKMQEDFDVEESLKSGTTEKINAWLKEKIHWHGATLTSKEIIKQVTGEDFNPKYYIEYLKNKYSKLYLEN